MKRFGFPKSVRLLKSAEFDRVFRARCTASDGLIAVHCARSRHERPRLGLTVSRKVGNAVARFRWKRILREAFRLVQHELPRHLDLVVVPRPAASPDVERLQSSLSQLTARAASKLPQADAGEEGPT